MLKPTCRIDVECRNIDVSQVHGCSTAVMGMNMPDPSIAVNSVGDMYRDRISRSHTMTHATVIAAVITGPPLRHCASMDRRSRVKLPIRMVLTVTPDAGRRR